MTLCVHTERGNVERGEGDADSGEQSMVQEQKVRELKERVGRGDYVVDPVQVADAILRRLRDRAKRQSECSYPDSDGGPSVNVTPLDPPETRPTQVSDAAAALWRALGGMQTHSS